jgi:gamma-glutamyltranspeptidase/glutathione hydrolase
MRPFAVLLALLALLTAPAALAERPAPKTAARPAPAAGHMLVAAANPMAAKAGWEVLQRGGSAADAAVAIQSVLGLVEPQSSGLGGGSFMTFYDGATGKVVAYNGRETAPMGARPDMFMGSDGKPLTYPIAVVSGRATGVPGAIGLLALVQHEHGKLPWASLFTTAEKMADDGFPVPKRLGRYINGHFAESATPDVIAYSGKPGGGYYQVGDTLKNPAYAATLRQLGETDGRALYEGAVAEKIVEKTHLDPLPGTMTLADLKAYHPKETPALCAPYRLYIVCTTPPPSSGVMVLEALGMLSHTDIGKRGPNDPKAWFELAQAERLAYADRDHYVGDPAFVRVPTQGMIDPAYDKARSALIGDRAGPPPVAGDPPGAEPRGPDRTKEPGGTSHFVVVDRWGNVVSMTTTVESIFGTGRMVDGFFLNNQLTDFSYSPVDASGQPVANAVAPGKRPRSSMAPVIVLDRQGRFVAAVGSPGSNAIPAYVLKTLVGVLDWKLRMQQAIDLPNLIARGSTFTGETDKFAPGVVDGLRSMGIDVKPHGGEESGLHGVMLRNGKLDGGADPRREGVVLKD